MFSDDRRIKKQLAGHLAVYLLKANRLDLFTRQMKLEIFRVLTFVVFSLSMIFRIETADFDTEYM